MSDQGHDQGHDMVLVLRGVVRSLLARLPRCENYRNPADCWTEGERVPCDLCVARDILGERAP